MVPSQATIEVPYLEFKRKFYKRQRPEQHLSPEHDAALELVRAARLSGLAPVDRRPFCEHCGLHLRNASDMALNEHYKGKKHLQNLRQYYLALPQSQPEETQRILSNVAAAHEEVRRGAYSHSSSVGHTHSGYADWLMARQLAVTAHAAVDTELCELHRRVQAIQAAQAWKAEHTSTTRKR